ncbi:ATP-binding protein [Mycobacterium sp. M1]|uniref:ATP-binding protein n=1 Tax=Mycolicibacter acidiphilus TaxID=2835306 RepID=A0ABS5RNQ1_9MYCO|nr:ATP-binding protein [Mycolicibacter acidiphilus]MBS9535927.1 ATP-binding protein [Mycolicibacter acidiphilus]
MSKTGRGPAQHGTARVYADVRDFPIYVSHIDESTRLWFAPWRIWDGATFLAGAAATLWATKSGLESGHAAAIFIIGAGLTGALTVAARQVPVTKPSPLYRLWWLLSGLFTTQHRGRTASQGDRFLGAPDEVIGNLVFTAGGVYAEFILAGQPGGMMPFDMKDEVASGHRPLVRQLPSGMTFWGVSAVVSPRRIVSRMLAGHDDRNAWVSEVRDWQDFLAIEPFYEQIFGVRIPVDAGMAGRNGAGGVAKAANVIVGRDPDDPQSLAGYQELVDQLLTKIPARFAPTPATPRQIRWLYLRHWTRGAQEVPFPHDPGGPDRLSSADFTSYVPHFDAGDQQSRRVHRSWWRRRVPALTPVLRIGGAAAAAPDSYQTMLPVSQLPRAGLAYPRAELLLAPYDVDVDAAVDWFQHVTLNSAERALTRVDRAQRNLNDQSWQRVGRRASHTDLQERFDSAEDYNAELRSSGLEREVEATTVLAVGARTAKAALTAAQQLHTHFAEELETVVKAPHGGAQLALWQIGHTGSEERAPRSQFCQPTTTKHWARFAPLVSSELGNDTGILFARNMNTRRPAPVLLDLEGTPERRGAPGMFFIGAPGGGKSQGAKRVVDGLVKRGSQVSITDPGTMREWEPALAHHGDAVAVLDPARGKVSMDGLRIFPREVAVERTLDHLLPMMGAEPDSDVARQFRFLLRPDQRVAESMGALMRYLDGLHGAQRREYEALTNRLDMWARVDFLRAMFDESLPVPPIADKDVVIWLTAALELPNSTQTDQLHQYKKQSARARAGFAIYGLIAALTRETYTGPNRRPGGFGWFVAEEARSYFASPVGREDTQRIVTQGRKERYGLIGISQHIEHFEGISTQDLPNRVVTPFKPSERDYAREAYRKIGIDPDEYPEVLDLRTVRGHGYAYLLDEFGRAGLVDMLAPVQPDLVAAFDTRDISAHAGTHNSISGGGL